MASNYNLTVKDWKVINRLEHDQFFKDLFFKKAEEFKWFYVLKERGYFEPEKNPPPRESEKKDGFFHIPFWSVLDYLDKLSKQSESNNYEIIAKELLNIIISISDFKNTEGKHTDNHHTWSSIVEILSNIPAALIPDDIFRYIPIWLDSRFDNMLTTSAIVQKLIPHIAKSFQAENPNPRAIDQLSIILEGLFDYKWEDIDEGFGKKREPILKADPYWILEAFSSEGYINKLMKIEFYRPIKIVADKLADVLSLIQEPARPIVSYDNSNYEIIMRFNEKNEILINICPSETADPYSKRDNLDEVLAKSVKEFNLKSIESERLFGDYRGFVYSFRNNLTDELGAGLARQFSDEELLYSYHLLIDDHSWIWFKDLSNIDDRHRRKVHHVLMIVLADMVGAAAYVRPQDVTPLLQELCNPKYHGLIYRRVIFLAISKNWDILKSLFREIFGQSDSNLLLSFNVFEPEIYVLFENIADKLTQTDAENLAKIIEKGKVIFDNGSEKDKERIQNEFRVKWFGALKKNAIIRKEYDKYLKSVEDEYTPGFRQATTFFGHGDSPLEIEEILGMPPPKLADYLESYRSKDQWRGPNVNALADNIHAAAKEKPEHFVDKIDLFLDTRFLYIYEILFGLRDAWRENKNINWQKLLPFLTRYVDRKSFWNDELVVQDDEYKAKHGWIVGMIAWLIQDGTESDKHAIDMELNGLIIELLKKLWVGLSKETIDDKFNLDSRPVDFAVNSTIGKVLQASIYLSLRIARNRPENEKEEIVRWRPELKNIFIEAINKTYSEPFIFLGWMLPQITYLDKTFAEKARNDIFDSKGEFVWKIFFCSYLFGSLSSPLYFRHMVDHYRWAINNPLTEWDTEELLMEHIGIGYLRGIKNFDLENGLTKDVFSVWNNVRIGYLLNFFVHQYHVGLKPTDKALNPYFDRIFNIWRLIYNKYKDISEANLTDMDKELLSKSAGLIVFITEIDKENYEWLSLAASYIHIHYNSHQLVEHLDRLKNSGVPKITSEYIGKLYLRMIENYKPDYDIEKIKSTLDFIYASGNKDLATDICEKYLAGDDGTRFLFVREIWKKYNS
ncbi:MAG: hypothetical protein AB1746_05930 [Candidatus Zixiibacteriota bacterium]